MRLALHTDYALRTLMYLAARGRRARVDDIAGFFAISAHHVAKVVQQLARLGFVRSHRGAGGGLELARPAADIRVGEVITAMEGNTHLLECVGTDDVCVIQAACRLRHVLAKAERLQMDYLDNVRLADLVRPGETLQRSLPRR
jgi:Rrf2 family nitric oxide-sensitive transcriptional repressor